MSWITLNDITVRTDEILAIEMIMEKTEHVFTVHFKTLKAMRVHLEATGGKWLYVMYERGIKEAQRGGLEYERL